MEYKTIKIEKNRKKKTKIKNRENRKKTKTFNQNSKLLSLLSLIIAVVLALIGVAGDFYIKLSGLGPKFMEVKWFIIGFIIYGATAFGWFYVMKHVKLATLGVFYAISTVLFVTLLGVLYFKERINIYEIVGIGAQFHL